MGGLRFDSLSDLPPGVRNQVAAKLVAAKEKKPAKYHNEPITVSGIRFDSRKEAERYMYLVDAVKEGVIYDLRLQQNFTLLEGYTTPTGERIKPITYRADFTYRVKWPWYAVPTAIRMEDLEYWKSAAIKGGNGVRIIEDVKSTGTKTRVYLNKYKMMADLGHHIREV